MLGDPANDFQPDIAGFQVTNAVGVKIADLVSYQNAARLVNADGTPKVLDERNGARVPGATSANAVVMIQPDWAQYTQPRYPAPTNITVADQYNVLSPSGYGPNQVRVCDQCTFTDIFSQGGTAMRFETDGRGSRPNDVGCAGAGVTASSADRITLVYGNNIAAITPHCRHNGTVQVSHLRGFSDFNLVAFGKPDPGTPGFDRVTVDTLTGCGSGSAETAQMPRSDINTYQLRPSNDGVTPALTYTFGAGDFSWPDPAFGDQGALEKSILPGATYRRSSVACQ